MNLLPSLRPVIVEVAAAPTPPEASRLPPERDEASRLRCTPAEWTALLPRLQAVRWRADLILFTDHCLPILITDHCLPILITDHCLPITDILTSAFSLLTSIGEGALFAEETAIQEYFSLQPSHFTLAHIWAHEPGVLYFAKAVQNHSLEMLRPPRTDIRRWEWRRGAELRVPTHSAETVRLWHVAAAPSPPKRDGASLLLAHGKVKVNLSAFERELPENEMITGWHGLALEQIVMQRQARKRLQDILNPPAHFPTGSLSLSPQAAAAARRAIADHARARAPLRPLPDIQRLAYLDEFDEITCRKDLAGEKVGKWESENGSLAHPPTFSPAHFPLFRAGLSYPIRAESVAFCRPATRLNLHGEPEQVEYSGRETVFVIEVRSEKSEVRNEVWFVDARLSPHVTLPTSPFTPPFTLADLVAHFIIPSVPDVAALNAERYADNLKRLEEF